MKKRVRILRGDTWATQLRDDLVQSPLDTPHWMEEHTHILRSDIYCLSGLLGFDHEVCFLKLHYFQSNLQKLLCKLGIKRPLRYFATARDLGAEGLALPRPLACLLVPEGILLLVEGLSGGSNLAELWRRRPGANEARAVMRAAGESLSLLHRLGYAYGRCAWSNLFWDGHRVHLVDLDKVRKSPLRSVEQSQDLARFTVNAEELSIGSDLYEQFLDRYVRGLEEHRRDVIQRMLPYLYRFREVHLARYGPHGQRLV